MSVAWLGYKASWADGANAKSLPPHHDTTWSDQIKGLEKVAGKYWNSVAVSPTLPVEWPDRRSVRVIVALHDRGRLKELRLDRPKGVVSGGRAGRDFLHVRVGAALGLHWRWLRGNW